MKKTNIYLLGILILSALSAPQAMAAKLYFTSTTSLVQGCPASAQIQMDTQGANILAGDVKLLYSDTEMSVDSISTGPTLPMQILKEIGASSVSLSTSRFPLTGAFSGMGPYGYIAFTPKAGASQVNLNFSSDIVNDNRLANDNADNVLTAVENKTLPVSPRYDTDIDGIGFCTPDSAPPSISLNDPLPYSKNNSLATDVKIQVTDNRKGVNLSSITFKVNGVSYLPTSTEVTTTLQSNGYLFTINPSTDFDQNALIPVEVSACDQNIPANCGTFQSQFDTIAPEKIVGCISPDFTVSRCGDGETNKDLNEECDDGNIMGGDGCSETCKYELAQCTTQIVEKLVEVPLKEVCGAPSAYNIEKEVPPVTEPPKTANLLDNQIIGKLAPKPLPTDYAKNITNQPCHDEAPFSSIEILGPKNYEISSDLIPEIIGSVTKNVNRVVLYKTMLNESGNRIINEPKEKIAETSSFGDYPVVEGCDATRSYKNFSFNGYQPFEPNKKYLIEAEGFYAEPENKSLIAAINLDFQTDAFPNPPANLKLDGIPIPEDKIAASKFWASVLAENEEGKSQLTIQNERPVLTGETSEGAQVFAVWRSVVLNSQAIASDDAGDFLIRAPRSLEKGTTHRVTVYAMKHDKDGKSYRSPDKTVYFYVGEVPFPTFEIIAIVGGFSLIAALAFLFRKKILKALNRGNKLLIK